jgi:acyl-CoA thioesterase-2
MSDPVTELLTTLDLETLELNLFRGRSDYTAWQRVFGGQVIGQALMAACRTVENRLPHSLHGYFILPGDSKLPIVYEVERVRDGRSFSTRRVKAIQRGQTIFTLSASFQSEEGGFDHFVPMPDVPMPEDLPNGDQTGLQVAPGMPPSVQQYFARKRPVELRPVDVTRYVSREPRDPVFRMWIRATAPLPDNPIIHRCVLAYASDIALLDSALVAHGRSVFDPDIQAASLDHALWFHRPFKADEWLLYAHDSPSSGGARGFSRGSVYTRDGILVASVAQEGLIRHRTAKVPAG